MSEPVTLTPEEHRILSRGEIQVHDLSNAAPGTYGGYVMDLARKAMLEHSRWEPEEGCPGLGFSTYKTTPAGRDALVSYQPPYVPMTKAETPNG